ncbi:MAG: arsenic efflux protein [Alphaproteobacteria bacterium]|nr:arsenic efflux protein [Alphaproteobacteria bacterium]
MLNAGFDILVDSLYETLSLFFYLYPTYLLMEYLEHRMSRRSMIYIRKAKQFGPAVGAVTGLIPQCGFSAAASNLYATGLITLGTLIAVFLATSDEMVPVLLSGGVGAAMITKVLGLKVLFGAAAGFLIDLFLPQKFISHKKEPDIEAFCQREKCKCNNKENIWRSAFKHTEKISLFIFLFALIINTAFMFGGKEILQDMLVSAPVLSKFIAAGIGLIPSCYPSVLISQLYLEGTISFGTLMAGTLSNAGLGLLVLYRVNVNLKENLRISALLYGLGVFFGLITEFLFA